MRVLTRSLEVSSVGRDVDGDGDGGDRTHTTAGVEDEEEEVVAGGFGST